MKTSKNKPTNISTLITKKRKELGLTQADSAKLLGYTSAQFVSDWERSVSVIPFCKIKIYANFLKTPVSILIEALLKDYKISMQEEIKKS